MKIKDKISSTLVILISILLMLVTIAPVVNSQFGIEKTDNETSLFYPKVTDKVTISNLDNRNGDIFIKLPQNSITMVVTISYSSYFSATLSNVPSGYDISDGSYLSWCIDLDHNIQKNYPYQTMTYSSYNTSMPGYLWHENLSLVNYILNHKQGGKDQIQNAIWYVMDFGDHGLNSDGWYMVNDAIANGADYVPGIGDVIAIVGDAGYNVQYTVFEINVPTYSLNVNVDGSGSVDPSSGTYVSGNTVEIEAIADPGWTFDHWSGDLTGSTNPDTITMDSDKTVTAHFIQCQYTLTINTVGDGTVTKTPNQATYTYGTPVELEATAEPGWTFDHWSGDLTGSTNPDTIIMDSDKTVTAHFTEDHYTLTVIIEGNGTVDITPNQTNYTYGTSVELEATADPRWTFDHWSGDLTGSANPDTIIMDSDKTVTAHFLYVPDVEPPFVEITKPINAIYLLNKEIIPFKFFPLVVGSITIEVDATDDESGVDRVEFYIDGELQGEDNTSDYFWLWSDTTPGKHTIKVICYDNEGNDASQEITVWKWKFHPVLIGMVILIAILGVIGSNLLPSIFNIPI